MREKFSHIRRVRPSMRRGEMRSALEGRLRGASPHHRARDFRDVIEDRISAAVRKIRR